MNSKEPKRFTSKIEITPVNPFEESAPSRTSSEPATANSYKPTPPNVRHIPVTTDQPLGSDHLVVASPSRLAQNSSIKTLNHEYQSPEMNRKQPSVHYIPIFVEGGKDPIMPKNVETEAPVEQKLCSLDLVVPKRQSTVSGSDSAPFANPNSGVSAKHEQPIPLGQEREVPVVKATSAVTAAAAAPTAILTTPKSQTQAPTSSQLPPSTAKPNPLQQVQQVQREVDSLTRRVEQFNGTSRIDKEYLYLDEMLTRNLIKLDTMEVAGNEELRAARKNVIKCIQQAIVLLESKVPINKSNVSVVQDSDEESSQNSYLSQNKAAESSHNPTLNTTNAAMLNGTSVGEDANGYAKRDENPEKTNQFKI